MYLRILIPIAAIAALIAGPSNAHAVLLNCPQVIAVKAAAAPFPWTPTSRGDAILHFAEASYSCSTGTCTLSCGYSTPTSVYTFLDYKVPPGVCHYTNEGKSFECSWLPPPRHRGQ
jgi:hypothetical protein